MTPKKLCILNQVSDAASFVRSYNPLEWSVYTTHSSVVDYLKNVHALNSNHLSSEFNDAKILSYINTADETIEQFVSHLDILLSPKICAILKIPEIKVFQALFKYSLKYDYSGFIGVVDAIKTVVRRERFETILYLQGQRPTVLPVPITEALRDELKGNIIFDAPSYGNSSTNRRVVNDFWRKLRNRLLKRLLFRFRRLVRKCIPVYQGNAKNLLLLGSLYDLESVCDTLTGYNKIPYAPGELINDFLGFVIAVPKFAASLGAQSRASLNELRSYLGSLDVDQLSPCFISKHWTRACLDHLFYWFRELFWPLMSVHELFVRRGIAGCVWGNPPVFANSSALIQAYLAAQKVCVAGMQHGGCYGTQECHFVHFDGDFSRCSHYFSYGFTSDDLRKVYPHKRLACEIIPVGSVKEEERRRVRKRLVKLDVLFPLTNCTSSWFMVRRRSDELADLQLKIIKLLESETDMRTLIKPFPGFTERNFAHCQLLRKLKHARVAEVPLDEALNKWAPQLVIIEYPSTPLYEVLALDSDIFVFHESILPFSNEAQQLLERRAYLFGDFDEMLGAFCQFKNGTLPKLRCDGFYRKHVYRESARDAAIRNIRMLI